MHLPPPILRFSAVAFLCLGLPTPGRATDERVLVELVDGKRVTASLDSRTNPNVLWLTTSLGKGELCQSIPWTDVRRIKIGEQEFDGSLVHAAVALICQTSHERLETPSGQTRIDSETLKTGTWQQPDEQAKPRRHAPGHKVQAMSVSAWLANWDQDVAADGLMVELTPYDSWGDPVSCNGTANFTLQAWKTSGRDRHLEIRPERWSRSVRASDSTSGSLIFRLPFRTVQPQRNSDWWPHGVLQVRLAVPGSGVVERTLSDLRLRYAEPMRDTWEQYTGHRYYPGENVQRHAWIEEWP